MANFEWTEMRDGRPYHLIADRFEWIGLLHGRPRLMTATRTRGGWAISKTEAVGDDCHPAARFHLTEVRVDELHLVIADKVPTGWDAAERDTWEICWYPTTLTKRTELKLNHMATAIMADTMGSLTATAA